MDGRTVNAWKLAVVFGWGLVLGVVAGTGRATAQDAPVVVCETLMAPGEKKVAATIAEQRARGFATTAITPLASAAVVCSW